MKLWAGRFSKEADTKLDDFNSSIGVDNRMYKHDILGSMAHVTMLGKQNIVSSEESIKLSNTLQEMLEEIESEKLNIDFAYEDIHSFVEAELTKRLGDVGKKLHTGRSRNDQVALDIRMTLREEIDVMVLQLEDFVDVLLHKAQQHTETIMPGYTHLQRAQPITFAHHLMAYVEMLLRDIARLKDCKERMNVLPLGSGALATTTHKLDREFVAEQLAFSAVTQNSLDGVSDRDFIIELVSALSIIMMHLSRFSEEVILWCSWEFKFIELDDAFSTGSSIMPQKKNPDIAELVRGKTGRVYGGLMSILTVMKSLPLAYNKDLQEDKEIVFDAIDTVKSCVGAFSPMIKTCKVLEENMYNAAGKGFINATDCADYLVKKGKPFREAYKITGEIVAYCIEKNKVLEQMSLEEYHTFSNVFEEDVFPAISLKTCVMQRKVIGGPAPEVVKAHIESVMNRNK